MDMKFSTYLIQEIDDELFDRLFEASRPHFDPDVDALNPTFFNWAQGYRAKRDHMLASYRSWLKELNGFVFAIAVNDEPVMLHAGQILYGRAVSYLTLLGPYDNSLSWIRNPAVYEHVEQWFSNPNPLNTHYLTVHTAGSGSGYDFIIDQFDSMFTPTARRGVKTSATRHYLDQNQEMQTFNYTSQEITWDFTPKVTG